jgi:F-type H+-transporting ATPase subunit c
MRHFRYVFMTLAALFAAVPAFAQTAGSAVSSSATWVPLGAGIGMGIASGFCGIGQGLATLGATQGVSRNPGARPLIQFMFVLGLAFIESLALFTLVIVFAKVK